MAHREIDELVESNRRAERVNLSYDEASLWERAVAAATDPDGLECSDDFRRVTITVKKTDWAMVETLALGASGLLPLAIGVDAADVPPCDLAAGMIRVMALEVLMELNSEYDVGVPVSELAALLAEIREHYRNIHEAAKDRLGNIR